MRNSIQFEIGDLDLFRKKLVGWASDFENFCILDSNSDKVEGSRIDKYASYDLLAGIGMINYIKPENDFFNSLKNYSGLINDWKFGHFNFDVKQETESITSSNHDFIGIPDMFFFQPTWVITLKNNKGSFLYPDFISLSEAELQLKTLQKSTFFKKLIHLKNNLKCRVGKEEYIENVNELKNHIARGDIYEINYCIDYFATNYELDPYSTWLTLNSYSPNPFSAFYKQNDKFLLSTSPERFLKKVNTKIISQPIKGTKRRGATQDEDLLLKNELKGDPKELAENIMITDLVRNDLSKTAKPGSVKVEEFCEVYTFRHVHQMISTITSELGDEFNFIDAIKNSFPMGSMTGAPKNSALKLIEKYENIKRGIFSGSVGYFDPENGFDFNVVIRSILYNQTTKNISIPIGSAITDNSSPLEEYDECMLKAKPLLEILKMK